MSAINDSQAAALHQTDPIIISHYHRLYEAVSDFNDESGIARDVEVLADLLNGWINEATGADKMDQTDHARTYPIRDHHINMIFSATQMMVNVARIKEAWQKIQAHQPVNHGRGE